MTHRTDMCVIKKLIQNWDNCITYWDIYQWHLQQTRKSGVYDKSTGILDKWLWKYKDYKVSQLRFV